MKGFSGPTLFAPNHAIFCSQFCVNQANEKEFSHNYEALKNSTEWKSLHQPTVDKIKRIGPRKNKWLRVAAKHRDTQTIKSLLEQPQTIQDLDDLYIPVILQNDCIV